MKKIDKEIAEQKAHELLEKRKQNANKVKEC
jgi:hypothetical protein